MDARERRGREKKERGLFIIISTFNLPDFSRPGFFK